VPRHLTICAQVHVRLTVDAGPGSDAEETAELADRLREELEAHEVDAEAVPAAAPEGSKGLGVDVGSLLVALSASGGVLTTLIGTLQAWLLRQSGSKLLLEIDGDRIELTGASDEERRRALDAWLARHERP
jgi:membrane-associated two-gene conflict system component 1 (EACC1)